MTRTGWLEEIYNYTDKYDLFHLLVGIMISLVLEWVIMDEYINRHNVQRLPIVQLENKFLIK